MPGAIALQRMPCLPYCPAIALVSDSMPALEQP